MKRLVLLACTALASTSAFASFDLLFVAENGTSADGTGLNTRYIKRFDPVTGAYLGQFGGGLNHFVTMCVVPSRRQVYAVESGLGTFAYSMDTGDLVAQYNTVPLSLRLNASRTGFLTTYGGDAAYSTSFDFTGLTTVATPHAGSAISDIIALGTGAYAALESTTNTVRFLNSSGVETTFWTTTSGYTTRLAGSGYNSQNLTVTYTSATNPSYTYGVQVAATGTPNIQGVVNTSGVSSAWLAGAPAHTGSYLMGNSTGSGTPKMVFRTDGNGNPLYSFGSGQFTNPIAMDTYLAPEPGTWAALGLGAVAVLRRRRK